jgi:membrane fusion protein, multidrug efflux system
MKRSQKAGICIVLIVAVFAVAFKLYDVKRNKSELIAIVKKAKTEIPVITTKVTSESLQLDVTYNGTFEPWCDVTVISESQGKVKECYIHEGDFIDEGDQIVWIDNDLAGYQLEIAESAYKKAQDELMRFENLSPGEAVSRQQIEDVRLALKSAKSTFSTVKKQYENGFIKAPVSGIISRKYFEKGSYIAPGSPVADIIDIHRMKFNGWFTASDVIQVKTGQSVILTTDLYPGVTYKGTISVVGLEPDNSRCYLVQAEVMNNQEKRLLPGIDGTIHIKTKYGRKSLLIPRNCIEGSMQKPTVYVIENSIAKLREIVVSDIVNNMAIIESGLAEGESVVLSGQINLENNTAVNISNDQNF